MGRSPRVADDEVAFRCTPRQLRNTRIAAAVAFSVSAVAGVIQSQCYTATIFPGFVGAPAFIAGGAFLGAYLAGARGLTVIGPRGFRCRRLSGWDVYRWEQIAVVACGVQVSRGSRYYAVIATTADGDRIRLSAPAVSAFMGDPDFPGKFQQIRGAWQAATGRTSPEFERRPVWTLGFVLRTLTMTAQLLVVCVVGAVVTTYAPALSAHEDGGVRGTFTSQSSPCGVPAPPACPWNGQFDDNGHYRVVAMAAGGPPIARPNVTVPAVDTGDQSDVYPLGGGTTWELPAATVAAGAAVILAIALGQIIVPLTLVRRRRRRSRAGLALLGDPPLTG